MHSHLDYPVLGGNGPGYYDSVVSTTELNDAQPAFGGLGCTGGCGPTGRGVSGIANGAGIPGMGGVYGVQRGAVRQYGMFGLGEETATPVKDAVIAETTNKLVLVGAGVGLGLALYHLVFAKRK